MKDFGIIFALGTFATYLVAAMLWETHHKAAAAAVVVVSPFPCPPGLPC